MCYNKAHMEHDEQQCVELINRLAQNLSRSLERMSSEFFSEQENILIRLDILYHHLGIPTQNYTVEYGDQDASDPKSRPIIKKRSNS